MRMALFSSFGLSVPGVSERVAMTKVWRRGLPFTFRSNEFGGRVHLKGSEIIISLYVRQEMDSTLSSSL